MLKRTKTSPNETTPDIQAAMLRVIEQQDKKAFAQIFHHFAPRLKSFFLQQGCTSELAEEIIQQTMLTLWEKAPQYDPDKAKLSTWIYTIARRKKIDIQRAESRRNIDHTPLEQQNLTSDLDQEDTLQQSQQRKQVHAALSQLPADQAKLLRMSFFDQLSHQKISESLNLPLGTVKSRLRLAIDKMRHHFYKKEDTHA